MRSEQDVNRAVEEYSDLVFRLCMVLLKNSADAEDTFQTVFLKYALTNNTFESPEHEKAWLIRVTTNACKDLMKSFFRKNTIPMEEIAAYDPEITPERYTVMEAIWSLPKHYREVIYLHYYEGYTAPEIAGILRKNPNTVYTHLFRARELLRDMLGGTDDGK